MFEKFDPNDYNFMKFMEQFLSKREKDARRNLASISSVCNTLSVAGTELSADEMNQCLNVILTSCCGMMKMTELYTRMIKALFNSDISFSTFDLNKYMKEFSAGCNETLGKTCTVKYTSSEEMMFISTNEEFFEYILLSCVRRSVIDGAFDVEIVGEKMKNNDIVITFRPAGTDPALIRTVFNDLDLEEFIAVNSSLAEKMGGSFTYENGIMQLKVNYRESDGIVLRSPEITGNSTVMTSFHNMLADLSGYEFY